MMLIALFLMIAATSHPVTAASGKTGAPDSAVVLMYHRFGEDDVPATNIRLEQFEQHLQILADGGYQVWPLSRIMDHLDRGETLPPRTVAITADDAYRSVMTEAWPRVRERGWTMTLFVATDAVDRGYSRFLDWDEIRRLRDEGMEIGGHSASHGHLAFLTARAATADLERAATRLRAELGSVPDLFAYPFGEYGLNLREIVAKAGFRAAFGQHSGAIDGHRDRFDLPRFAMNELYGSPDRFTLAVNSLPLPVTDAAPRETLARAGDRPTYSFRLAPEMAARAGALTCYHSTAGAPVPLTVEGARIEFRSPAPLPPGRSRFNCTLPGPTETVGDRPALRWYWFGRQFVTPGGPD